ncbi:MAG: branched-chain amino acid ABC transporter permease [Rhizobiaceae bacterium]
MILMVTQLLNGFQLGLLLFLLAAGLTLVFGIMDLVHLAHGSFYMIGAFLCAAISAATGSFLIGAALAIPLTFLAGVVVEAATLRTLYTRHHLDHVLATFGLILFFDTAVHLVWGPGGLPVNLPSYLDGSIELPGGVFIPTIRIVIIGVGLLVAAFLYALITKTRMGMLIRAGASNRTMAGAMGVDIKRLFTLIFGLGSALAGLAGIMAIAITTEASIGMGTGIIIQSFVVIVIGGVGSIRGAFIAAIIVGMVDTLGRSYLDQFFKLFLSEQSAETAAPAISAMSIYILMAAVLFFRPQGLFPPTAR